MCAYVFVCEDEHVFLNLCFSDTIVLRKRDSVTVKPVILDFFRGGLTRLILIVWYLSINKTKSIYHMKFSTISHSLVMFAKATGQGLNCVRMAQFTLLGPSSSKSFDYH